MPMTPDEYRALRASLGSQDKVAKLLDVCVASVVKREAGSQRIRREAEFALRWAALVESQHPTPDLVGLRSNGNGPDYTTRRRKAAKRKQAKR